MIIIACLPMSGYKLKLALFLARNKTQQQKKIPLDNKKEKSASEFSSPKSEAKHCSLDRLKNKNFFLSIIRLYYLTKFK